MIVPRRRRLARLLVLERGWALDEYEHWFATSLAAALLPSNTRA